MAKQVFGICMFCGASGVTKAHVFAQSWTKLFDEPNDTREHEVVHRYTDPVSGETRVLKRAKSFAMWSRKVCGSCNGGWLRELEERVEPLMAHFAANQPVMLYRNEQADLALWSVAAALIAMSNDPEAAAFADPEVAHEIYREKRPPRGMDVWLGANAHGEMGWFASHSLHLTNAPEQSGAWGRRSRSAMPLCTWSSTASAVSGCDCGAPLSGRFAGSGHLASARLGHQSSSCAHTTSALSRFSLVRTPLSSVPSTNLTSDLALSEGTAQA